MFAEALLIVLSILLAFGIEAWWSRRGELLGEREALESLRADFIENLERLEEAQDSHDRIREAAARLLAMAGPDAEQVAGDLTMDTLPMRLVAGPQVFLVTATYDALIASGRIDVLRSSELRRELARWSAAMTNLGELERQAFVRMDQRFLPFIRDYVPITTLDLNVLPWYEGAEFQPSRFPRRYRELRRSRRFENAVEERMSSSVNALDGLQDAHAEASSRSRMVVPGSPALAVAADAVREGGERGTRLAARTHGSPGWPRSRTANPLGGQGGYEPMSTMPRRYVVLLNIYFVAVFVGIGGLQMYRVNAGVLTNYGADLFAPPYLYVMLRDGRLRLRSLTALSMVLGGCYLWESMQRYDLAGTPFAITRGSFDPFDLLAYTVGLTGIYVADVLWLRRRGILPSERARLTRQ